MGLIQEVQELASNERYFVSEKSKIRQEKQEKENLKSLLFNYFYDEFKKKQEDPNQINNKLSFVDERERIINILSKSNSLNLQFLNSIYSKVLKEVYTIFKNNLKFIEEQDKQIDIELTEQLHEQLKANGNFETALLVGFDPNKIYNEDEIIELNNKVKDFINQIEEQKKEERANLIWGLVNLLGYIFNPITLIIIFLIWSYFYFAVPVLRG